jgi:hypothetical protein
MPYKQIDAQLADADVQAIKTAITLIQTKLPFLGSLTDTERKELSKAGPEHVAQIQGAGQAAASNPTILPGTFDAVKFQNSVALFSTMTDLNTSLQQLSRSVDDTHMMIGVYAKSQSSDVYHYAQAAAKKTPGLQAVVDRLGVLNQKAAATRRANKNAKTALTAAQPAKP